MESNHTARSNEFTARRTFPVCPSCAPKVFSYQGARIKLIQAQLGQRELNSHEPGQSRWHYHYAMSQNDESRSELLLCRPSVILLLVSSKSDRHLLPAEPLFWLKAILQPLGERAHDRISLDIQANAAMIFPL